MAGRHEPFLRRLNSVGQSWEVHLQVKPQLSEVLASIGDGWKLRLVDGLPAFPDEAVPSEFHEVRLALSGEMVTVVSEPFGYRLVTWSFVSPEFQNAVNRLAERLVFTGGGTIELQP